MNTAYGERYESALGPSDQRKKLGSYYTPDSLIQELLKTALDPLLEAAMLKPDPEAAILGLRICDPACGSGAFLIAAARRIAHRLAEIRTGQENPPADEVQTAKREVVRRCIYGVDLSPLAVELCKAALWTETYDPDKPCLFLDHHIRQGNALVGALPQLMEQGIPDGAFEPIEGDDRQYCNEWRKKNRQSQAFQKGLFGSAPLRRRDYMTPLSKRASMLDDVIDDTLEESRWKRELWDLLRRSPEYRYGTLIADAWCAAFFWLKRPDPKLLYPITNDVFREIRQNPEKCPDWMVEEIGRLARQSHFFHWHLAFPNVLQDLNLNGSRGADHATV